MKPIKHIKALSMGTVLVIIALIAVFLFSRSGGSKAAQMKQEIKNVTAVEAMVSSLTTDVEYASKLQPITEVTISPKIAGKVAQVNVKAGDKVEKGQVLFTLESGDLQAQLQQQQANLEANKANLAKTESSSLDQEIMQAEQTVQSKQIAYNDAKKKYEQNQQLYANGVISQSSLDDFQKQYQNAQLDLNSAQDNLNLLKEKTGPESVEVASAQVNQAAAGVDAAEEQLNNTVITSPISGTVSARNVEVGEIVSSSTSAFTVIDNGTLAAEISVPDKMVTKITKGQTVPVKINALNNKTLDGVVDYVSPDADSKSQAYTIKILVQAAADLKSGMFARVVLPEEEKSNILTIPNEAIKIENSVAYVYTATTGVVKKVPVTTGLSNDKFTEIKSGLKAGDKVITEGQIFLNDGDKVKVVK